MSFQSLVNPTNVAQPQKILYISDGPIGNDIWSMPMLNGLISAGQNVEVVTAGFKHDIFPVGAQLHKSIDEVNLNSYDKIILRKGPKNEVPKDRWKTHLDVLNNINPDRLIEVPYNEGWVEGGYRSLSDSDIARQYGAVSIPRALMNLSKEEFEVAPTAPSNTPLYERVTEQAKLEARQHLLEVVCTDGPLVMIYAKTSSDFKNYPEEKWNEVAKKLTTAGCRVVFMGAAGDPQFSNEEKTVGSLVDKKLSLGQGYYLMHNFASIVLAGDTHACHAAAECQTPSLTLFGGSTISDLVAAHSDSSYVITTKEPTPASIEVDKIYKAALKIIHTHGKKQRFFYLQNIED